MSKKIGNLKGEPGKQADTPVIPWPRGGGSGVIVQDEGTNLNAGKIVSAVDFEGAGVSAAMSGTKAVVTIPGGGGGGGVTVEVPPAAPVAVTNLILPSATIAGGSATLVTTYQVTAQVTYQTPNITDANGSVIGTIPAGAKIIAAQAYPTIAWDGTGVSQILGTFLLYGVGSSTFIGIGDLWNADLPGVDTIRAALPVTIANIVAGAKAIDACDLRYSVSTDGTLTQGAADLVVIIATPAS